jgi:hypothetical protein
MLLCITAMFTGCAAVCACLCIPTCPPNILLLSCHLRIVCSVHWPHFKAAQLAACRLSGTCASSCHTTLQQLLPEQPPPPPPIRWPWKRLLLLPRHRDTLFLSVVVFE